MNRAQFRLFISRSFIRRDGNPVRLVMEAISGKITIPSCQTNQICQSKTSFGVVFHPKNLLKSLASQIPLASAGVENAQSN